MVRIGIVWISRQRNVGQALTKQVYEPTQPGRHACLAKRWIWTKFLPGLIPCNAAWKTNTSYRNTQSAKTTRATNFWQKLREIFVRCTQFGKLCECGHEYGIWTNQCWWKKLRNCISWWIRTAGWACTKHWQTTLKYGLWYAVTLCTLLCTTSGGNTCVHLLDISFSCSCADWLLN